MIKHPQFLPGVPIWEMERLPAIAGLYFVVHDDEIVYIGQSNNIRSRWVNGHHRYKEIYDLGYVSIHFLESDGRSLFQQEAEYVNFFSPKLNSATKYKPLPKNSIIMYLSFMYGMMAGVLALGVSIIFQIPVLIPYIGVWCILVMVFCVGGNFTWWYIRKVLRAKIVKDKQ